MALAPKRSGGDKASVRFMNPVLEDRLEETKPATAVQNKLEMETWGLFVEQAFTQQGLGLAPSKSPKELEEWRSFGEQVAAECAERELKAWEAWADDNFPIFPVIGRYTPVEMSELEERLMARVVLRKAKRNGHNGVVSRIVGPRGSTPTDLFGAPRYLLIAFGRYSPEAREVYGRLKKVLTDRILEDSSKFTAVLKGINGDQSAGVGGYLSHIRREKSEVLRERGLVEDVARLVNIMMPHYTGNAVPEEVQARFSMLVFDIIDYIPGVKHALNVLQAQQVFYQNGASPDEIPVNGNGLHEHRQKPPYINWSRHASRLVPKTSNHANGKPVVEAAFSQVLPKGIERALRKAYSPLPGVM